MRQAAAFAIAVFLCGFAPSPLRAGGGGFRAAGNWTPFPDSVGCRFLVRVEDLYDLNRVDPEPRLTLSVMTEQTFRRAVPTIEWKVEAKGTQIDVRLIGMRWSILGLCVDGRFPSSAREPMCLAEGRYELRLHCGGRRDVYDLDLSDSLIVLTPRRTHFSQAGAERQARYRENSCSIGCVTGDCCGDACASLVQWLLATGRFREIRYPQDVLPPAPFSRWEPGGPRVPPIRCFRYVSSADFDSAAAFVTSDRYSVLCGTSGLCLHDWRNRFVCAGVKDSSPRAARSGSSP